MLDLFKRGEKIVDLPHGSKLGETSNDENARERMNLVTLTNIESQYIAHLLSVAALRERGDKPEQERIRALRNRFITKELALDSLDKVLSVALVEGGNLA